MNSIYYNELSNIPTLSKEEQLALVIKAKAGDNKAKEQLINTNLRLVVHLAKMFQKYLPNDEALTLDDLICEGNIALTKAINDYHPDSGTTLTYFVGVVIKRQLVSFILTNNGAIKMPQRKMQELLKMEKNDHLDDFEQSAREKYYIPTKIQLPEYFEFPDNSDEADNESEMWEKIKSALKLLSPREKEIITYYHQLNGERKTQTEMAEIYGISKQRVGQIINQAIKKMNYGLDLA